MRGPSTLGQASHAYGPIDRVADAAVMYPGPESAGGTAEVAIKP